MSEKYKSTEDGLYFVSSSVVGFCRSFGKGLKKITSNEILKAKGDHIQENKKEWLLMIFTYHAKFNKQLKNSNFGHRKIKQLN